MEFIEDFAWPVPTAFSHALDRCRFRRGDRLYPSQMAYESGWLEAQSRMQHWIQIRYPEQITVPTTADGDSTFEGNWNSEVRLTLYEKHLEVDQIMTTQGRVYALLWYGDVNVLYDRQHEPQVPERASFLLKQIKAPCEELAGLCNGETTFLMPFDRVSPLSRDKFTRLEARLSDHLSRQPCFMRSNEVPLLNGHHIAPTAGLMSFPVGNLAPEELEAEVKTVLYQPAENATKHQFRISAHGVVV